MGFSNYLENAILADYITGAGVPVYVQLHTADPTDAGTGGVAAIARINATDKWAAPADGVTSNDEELLSVAAGSAIGNITHISLWDASAAGNMLYHGAVTTVKNLGSGDQYRIPVGQLTVTNT